MIEITEQQIDRINLILGGLNNAPKKAFTGVINRALTTVRSQSGKEVRKTYNIKQRDITSNQNIGLKRASGGSLEGEIRYAGTLIPLIKFNVNPSQPIQKPVSVSVLQSGGRKRLQHAYVANLGKYGVGVFERETYKRESSKELFGPSTVHMVDNKEVMANVQAAAMETIEKRVEHEITRILNGYT